jgi:hypothetical protein
MGLFKKRKDFSQTILTELAIRSNGVVTAYYDHFLNKGALTDDTKKLTLLFKAIGFVLLYVDSQIFAAYGSEARDKAIDKLLPLIGSALASGMPEDPEYKLDALIKPYVDLGSIHVQTNAYLLGMVQEVFAKYGTLLAQENGLEKLVINVARDLWDEFLDKNDPTLRIDLHMLLGSGLVSMKLRSLLS